MMNGEIPLHRLLTIGQGFVQRLLLRCADGLDLFESDHWSGQFRTNDSTEKGIMILDTLPGCPQNSKTTRISAISPGFFEFAFPLREEQWTGRSSGINTAIENTWRGAKPPGLVYGDNTPHDVAPGNTRAEQIQV
jgi:hypothetical protein